MRIQLSRVTKWWLVFVLAFTSANASAAKCVVYGEDDSSRDGDAIRAALHNARDGQCDRLELIGTFNLSVTEPSDDIVIPLPDGDSMKWFGDFLNTGIFFLTAPEKTQLFLLDVPGLTVSGSPYTPTVLRVNESFFELFQETGDFLSTVLQTDAPIFIVAAPGVTIKDLTFDGMAETIFTFWSGWRLKNLTFRRTGQGPFFFDDRRSIANRSVSRFVDNVFEPTTYQGIQIKTSNVTVSDNVFDHYGFSGIFTSASAAFEQLLPLSRDEAARNVITDNVFTGDAPAPYIFASNFWGGPIRELTIKDNVFDDVASGVLLVGENDGFGIAGSEIDDTRIIDNEFAVSSWGIILDSSNSDSVRDNSIEPALGALAFGVALFGTTDSQVVDNEIVTGEIGAIWAEWGIRPQTENCRIRDNNIRDAGVGVFLGPGAVDCVVNGNDIFSSIDVDYLLGSAFQNFGPAQGNLLVIDDEATFRDESGCDDTVCPANVIKIDD